MANFTHNERLQPSLLDRLTDERPGQEKEAYEQRIFSAANLRQCVLRDLAWLFNTGALESNVDLRHFPEVRKSVINFGLRDLSGKTLSQLDIPMIEFRVKQAILNFEPRIDAKTLRVSAQSASDQMNRHALSFYIEGDLWAHPLPVHLRIRSDFDLETGHATIVEGG